MKCHRCGGTGEEPNHVLIGQQMRAKRESVGRTLRETAGAMGVSPAYLSDLELGRRMWRAALTKRFTEAIR